MPVKIFSDKNSPFSEIRPYWSKKQEYASELQRPIFTNNVIVITSLIAYSR